MTDTKKRINQVLLKQIAEAVTKEDWELAEGLALMVAEGKPVNRVIGNWITAEDLKPRVMQVPCINLVHPFGGSVSSSGDLSEAKLHG